MSVTLHRTDSMDDLLDWFERHPCSCATIGYMNDELDWSRETIRSNLKQLAAAGNVELQHPETALYRLVADPRAED